MKLSIRVKCDGCPGCEGVLCSVAEKAISKKNLYSQLPDWCPLPDAESEEVLKSIALIKSALTKIRKDIKALG